MGNPATPFPGTRSSVDGTTGIVPVAGNNLTTSLLTDDYGRLWVNVFSGGGGGGGGPVWGNIAHDAVDEVPQYPVAIGFHASDETPAAVADADRVNQYGTLEGRGVVNADQVYGGEDLNLGVTWTARKPIGIEQNSLLPFRSEEELASFDVYGFPCRLYDINFQPSAGSALTTDLWLMVFDNTTTPSNGDVPVWSLPLEPGSMLCGFSFPDGLYLQNGLAMGVSTTLGTFTEASDLGFFQGLLYPA